MATLLVFGLLVGCGLVFGLLAGAYNVELNWALVLLIAIVLAYGLLFARNHYVFTRSRNLKEVERLLNRYRRRPYFRFLIASLNADFDEAAKQLTLVKNEQQRAIGMTAVYIHRQDMQMAKRENSKIQNEQVRYLNRAYIALLEGDMQEFQRSQGMLKNPTTKLVLDVEATYQEGRYDEAEKLGEKAISMARGLQKLSLVRGLERNQGDPHRKTYF